MASLLGGLFAWTAILASMPGVGVAGDWVLWYRRPADLLQRGPANGWSNSRGWVEALPVGNGRLGGMVYGGTGAERIQLNEDTLWSGRPQDADNPGAAKQLPEIRRLLFAGRYAEAQKLTYESLACRGPGTCGGSAADCDYGCYQTLGDLDLDFGPLPPTRDYRRELDLDTAVARVAFTANGVRRTREVFSSAPDQVLVVRVTTDLPGSLSFGVGLSRSNAASAQGEGASDLVLRGRLSNGKGMSFIARLRVVAEGGQVRQAGPGIRVEGADAVTLLLAAGTDYRGQDPVAAAGKQLEAAARKSYAALRADHVADHQRLFRRVTLDLGTSEAAALPTDERLAAFAKGGEDPQLAALYFQFGRYLLMASSRAGGLPANLQGLWAEGIQTPWNCDYHANINLQMNYWPAEVGNLAECHEPLLDFIESLREPGRKTARIQYGAKGWVCHTVMNVWGYTSPGEHPSWGQFPAASGWLCQHLWEHYDYSRDLAFLRRAWPAMREAAEFYLDFLVAEPRHGWLVTAPSNSPENGFRTADGQTAGVCYGPTMDIQIVRELFTNCAEASRLLGTDDGLRKSLEAAIAKLPPHQVGKHGQLQEWIEDFDETEPHHRHVSHLYGLYPGRQVSRYSTPDLARAARVTLERRGDDGTGWSLAWKINFWARLGDGDRAHKLLQRLLRPVVGSGVNMSNGGGTFPNLFDAHPPFQIDGNLGGCAGIAEMLMQSQSGEIELMPALPKAWPTGRVTGLRARGGFTADISWKDGRLQDAVLVSSRAGTTRVRSSTPIGSVIARSSSQAVPLQRGADGVVQFESEAGAGYDIRIGGR